MASVSKGYPMLHARTVIQNERPDRARLEQSFASALNQLAGWQFRRAIEGIWEHHPEWPLSFPFGGFATDGLPHVSGHADPARRRLELRWTASTLAEFVWVSFTYFVDDDWTGSAQEPSVDLSLFTAAGAVIDLGCRFSSSTGDLTAGYAWLGDSDEDDFGRILELNCIPHVADTGFVTQDITVASFQPRPLNLNGTSGDVILRIANEGVVISSVVAVEMWEPVI